MFSEAITMWTSNVMMARIAKHTNQFFGRAQVGPDRYWNRRRTFLMTSHLYGRSRNCYALAVRYNIGALELAVKLRDVKKKDAVDLWEDRLDGVANTLNYNSWHMREALARCGVYLDRHMLANLTLTEPRTMR